MRILFVCGSLEPGHDGVGDYVRELAGALNNQGIETRILAIMDREIDGISKASQSSSQSEVTVTRLSETLPSQARKREYHKTIEEFTPDWISLQYVPYAFSPKGIPFNLIRFLKVKNPTIKWHFMIHESYIGGVLGIKDRIIRRIQISTLKGLVEKFNPYRIHTSTSLYQRYLSDIGIKGELLGLFGNIPIFGKKCENHSDEIFRGVYFGSAPLTPYYEPIADAIKAFVQKENIKMEIILCGQSGEKGKGFANAIRSNFDPECLQVLEKGEMSAADLSQLFLTADFGIARVRANLLGKSGSAISMLEHGLPLWVPLSSDDAQIASDFNFRVDQCFSSLTDFKKQKRNFEPQSRLKEIALIFKASLIRNEKENSVL